MSDNKDALIYLADVRIDELEAENDALRELVRNLYVCINNRDCDYCEYVDEACEFERNMRELGIEVEV